MNLDQETLSIALEYLDKVGAKLGMTADTIWPWLIRQQYVYVATPFIIFAVACILVPTALYISRKYHPWNDKLYGTEDVDFVRVVRCASIVLAAITSVVGTVGVFCNLPKLINPEYYALKDLLNLIKY